MNKKLQDAIKSHTEYIIQTEMKYVEVGEGFWKQNDGNEVWIREMSSDHIDACINCIKRDIQNHKDDVLLSVIESANSKLAELKSECRKRLMKSLQ